MDIIDGVTRFIEAGRQRCVRRGVLSIVKRLICWKEGTRRAEKGADALTHSLPSICLGRLRLSFRSWNWSTGKWEKKWKMRPSVSLASNGGDTVRISH